MLKTRTILFLLFLAILFIYTSVSAYTSQMINPDNHVVKPAQNLEMTDEEVLLPEKYEGVYLEINKTKNTLKVFLNGYAVYTFRVATGKDISLTPEGRFNIVTKVQKPWYRPKNIPGGDKRNPLGTRWLGLNVPNTGGYKYGIHGTNNPYSIGHHISQGCIRMHNKDVEWLYRHIPLKTPVIITK